VEALVAPDDGQRPRLRQRVGVEQAGHVPLSGR
jgi:hypothetical protein